VTNTRRIPLLTVGIMRCSKCAQVCPPGGRETELIEVESDGDLPRVMYLVTHVGSCPCPSISSKGKCAREEGVNHEPPHRSFDGWEW
jgi:hypothetical protein